MLEPNPKITPTITSPNNKATPSDCPEEHVAVATTVRENSEPKFLSTNETTYVEGPIVWMHTEILS